MLSARPGNGPGHASGMRAAMDGPQGFLGGRRAEIGRRLAAEKGDGAFGPHPLSLSKKADSREGKKAPFAEKRGKEERKEERRVEGREA